MIRDISVRFMTIINHELNWVVTHVFALSKVLAVNSGNNTVTNINDKTKKADTTETKTFKSSPYFTKFLLCSLMVSFVLSIITRSLK
jgi:hypothetical protein